MFIEEKGNIRLVDLSTETNIFIYMTCFIYINDTTTAAAAATTTTTTTTYCN